MGVNVLGASRDDTVVQADMEGRPWLIILIQVPFNQLRK
jgi:hypothetical protein